MPNHLSHETSPYLLQHADNPVDWYPWNPTALDRARLEDKPIFLSIGYAACHWCHVMAHESFEDPGTAAILNEHFVSIKVDREERPDLDSIYMQAVVALTGQGGWPMSVFLTPDGQPFYSGTYFPPVQRHNLPAFKDVLLTIARLWTQDRSQLLSSAQQITTHLQNSSDNSGYAHQLSPADLEKNTLTLAQSYDWTHGGWGHAPKFPQPMTIEFLLRRASRGDKLALDMSTHVLHLMAKGGMYDVVGGGFSRYSTDDDWLVPHFEKMLYDNAQLALVYLHAYLITRDPSFRCICEETLDFISRELTSPEGGFYASLDADSEGVEGKYYLWSLPEIQAALTDPQDAALFIAAYAITPSGNFDGRTVLQRSLTDEQLSAQFSLPIADFPARFARLHALLRQTREQRVRPALDDKVILSWNALMLTAFAEAGRYLNHPEYSNMAMRSGRFLLDRLLVDGSLYRSWRIGRAQQPAFLEDYASLVRALLSLYQTDPNPAWYSAATQLASQIDSQFTDPAWGFYDTSSHDPALLLRPKDLQDNATPCGNSIAALAFLELSSYSANNDQRLLAETMLTHILPHALRYPTAFANWLCAADFSLGPTGEVAILGDSTDPSTRALVEVLWEAYRPHLVAAIAPYPFPPASPPLLHDRTLVDGHSAAYVCQSHICKLPVTTPVALRQALCLG